MKRTLILIGVVLVFAVFATSAFADGKYAGEFLNIGVGARALGMGGTFIGIANDGSAAYWNPAGMGGMHKKEIIAMYCPAALESVGTDDAGNLAGINVAQLGANYNYFGLVWTLGAMRIGASLVQLGIDGIYDTRGLEWDDDGDGIWETGERVFYNPDNMKEGSDMEQAIIVSFSQNFGPGLCVGANVKLLSQSVFEYEASGFGVDVGLMYRMNPGNPLMGEAASGLSVGIVARNLMDMSQMAWSVNEDKLDANGLPYYRDPAVYDGSAQNLMYPSVAAPAPATIPMGVGAGVSYTLSGMPGISAITVAADVMVGGILQDQQLMDFSAGMELWIVNMLAIRAGVKQLAGPTADLNVFTGSAGIGLKFADMVEVNYAFSGLFNIGAQDGLGAAHRMSLSFRF